jgi:hypothetical protein
MITKTCRASIDAIVARRKAECERRELIADFIEEWEFFNDPEVIKQVIEANKQWLPPVEIIQLRRNPNERR